MPTTNTTPRVRFPFAAGSNPSEPLPADFIVTSVQAILEGNNVQVDTLHEAWQVVNAFLEEMECNCERNNAISGITGYPVYTSTNMDACRLSICDMSNIQGRLEVVFTDDSENTKLAFIWVMEKCQAHAEESNEDDSDDDFDSIDLPEGWEEEVEELMAAELEQEMQAEREAAESVGQLAHVKSQDSSELEETTAEGKPFPFDVAEITALHSALRLYRESMLDELVSADGYAYYRHIADVHVFVQELHNAITNPPRTLEELPLTLQRLIDAEYAVERYRDMWLDALVENQEAPNSALHVIGDQVASMHALKCKIKKLCDEKVG